METALARLSDEARAYLEQAKAPATLQVYRRDWRAFTAWCAERGRVALPADAETTALYLAERARTDKPATLSRRLAAISVAHQAANHEPPTRSPAVRAVLQGIRRSKGVAQRRKAPALADDVRAMVAVLPDSLLGQRDRALLLVGFASSLRRSELAALMADDLAWTAEGVALTVRRSKTDQEGAGRKIGIPYGRHAATCPVRALRAWLAAAGIADGPVFRGMTNRGAVRPGAITPQSIALVVKRAIGRTGKDPALYAGHSLRAGLITETVRSAPHLSERDVMAHTGHRSVQVFRGYVRDGSIWRANPAAEVGL